MQTSDFKSAIIEHYFPDYCKGEYATFADDYAKIGAFLTRKEYVLEKLEPLERKLRALAKENIRTHSITPEVGQGKTIYDTVGVTKKILDRALQDVETQAGFNSAKYGLLHSRSTFGTTSTAEVDLKADGRTGNGAQNVKLPAGVPKIVGPIDSMDFMVLLKHGYAFKDVGAESGHGEFTHRLQWYAIIQAKDEIGLTNEPIKLYKEMWFSRTRGTHNLGQHKLYMWVALLDNFQSEAEAINSDTLAWCSKTFNSPEFMNACLMNTNGNGMDLDEQNMSNLFVLRRLLKKRALKRQKSYDNNDNYAQKKILEAKGNKTILSGGMNTGTMNLSDLKQAVIWIDSL